MSLSTRRHLMLATAALPWLGFGLPALGADGGDRGHDRGKPRRKDPDEREGPGHEPPRVGGYFGERERSAAHEYYRGRAASGHCPPGLAKKHNGCMPPGHARAWALGQPLPGSVVFYPVPQQVVVRLGLPPKGYRYVRIANDILLIAIGTRMVIDAIEDLTR